jgi:hypothetical protein
VGRVSKSFSTGRSNATPAGSAFASGTRLPVDGAECVEILEPEHPQHYGGRCPQKAVALTLRMPLGQSLGDAIASDRSKCGLQSLSPLTHDRESPDGSSNKLSDSDEFCAEQPRDKQGLNRAEFRTGK